MRVFNKLKTPLSEKKDDLLRVIDASKGIIAELQHQKSVLESDIKVKMNNADIIDFTISESKKELESFKIKLSELSKEIQEKNKEKQRLVVEIDRLLKYRHETVTKNIELQREYNEKITYLGDAFTQREKDFNIALKSVENDIEKAKKSLEVVKSQELASEKKKDEYNSLIQELNGEITDLVNKKNKMLDVETTNLAIQDKLFKDIKELKNDKDKLLLEISQIKEKKDIANGELKVKEDRLIELEDRAISRIERERKIEQAAEKIKEAYQKAGVEINL